MKRIVYAILAVTFNFIAGSFIGLLAGANTMLFGMLGVVLGVLLSFVPKTHRALYAGVLVEIWTGELIKALRAGLDATFLDGIPDNTSVVNDDVIHLVDVGIDPDVLINNTTYPIAMQSLTDNDKTIRLDKFQTKVTPIQDDELYALSYDKMNRVKESHANAINDAKFAKSAWNLCPASNADKTPVLKTTGEYENGTSGRRKLTMQDVINLKSKFDNMKIPADGRRLVLCSDHINDLLATAQSFREMYSIDRTDGTVGRLYGFDIYEFSNCPCYTTAGVKKDLGSTCAAGEYQASFAFFTQRVFKATGSTKMYYRDSATDPQNQQNLINFKHYFVCIPKKLDAMGAIMSDYKAA